MLITHTVELTVLLLVLEKMNHFNRFFCQLPVLNVLADLPSYAYAIILSFLLQYFNNTSITWSSGAIKSHFSSSNSSVYLHKSGTCDTACDFLFFIFL